MRAAKFERLTWAAPDTPVMVTDPGPASTRPGDQGIVAFGIALALWDGLREAVAAITIRARHARTGWGGP